MITRSETSAASGLIPTELASLLGNPPLLRSENRELYERRVEELVKALPSPLDYFAHRLVRDYADAEWEVERLKSHMVHALNSRRKEGLYSLLHTYVDGENSEQVAGELTELYFRDEAGQRTVLEKFPQYDLGEEAIRAQALVLGLDPAEKMDRLLTRAEARKRAAVRDLEHYLESALWKRRSAPTDAGL